MRPSLLARLLAALLGVGGLGWLGAPAAAAAPAAPDTGWRWPLPGHPAVGAAFRPPATPYSAGHRGVDLVAAPASPVLAVAAGVVHYAGLVAGRGVVTIDHPGGLRSEYEPVTPAVRAGQHVTRGQRIGVLAAPSPGCGGWCLHWGVERGAAYLDPLAFVGVAVVRLLPMGRVASVPAGASPAGVASGSSAPSVTGAAAGPSSGPPGRSSARAVVARAGPALLGGLGLLMGAVLRRRARARAP